MVCGLANEYHFPGKWVVNPSGGLISKGHPIGATGTCHISSYFLRLNSFLSFSLGIAQAVELVNQLRGRCGLRHVQNCEYELQHNIGKLGMGARRM